VKKAWTKWLGAGLFAVAMAATAGYPSPEQVGFHHCVLVYDKPRRSSRDLAPYVADMAGGRPQRWMFDAFLFLALRTPAGRLTTTGATTKDDWDWLLQRWFAPGRDLAALDDAVDVAARTLGPPPSPRRIILGIPRPNRTVADFGDVTGSGHSEDLGTANGIPNVLRWYVREAVHRFRTARFRHLTLWGFYWIHETVPATDEPLVRTAAAEIHSVARRFLWIPWFRARGWENWRKLGFDAAVLQPNYAFFSKHQGEVRRDRLAFAAQLAATQGMGIELELPMAADDPRARFYFLRYLADGAPDRYGYQAGVTAWYLGRDNLERLSRSDRAWQQQMVRAMARFVRGDPVPDPDPRPEWRVDEAPAPALADGNWAVPRKAVSKAVAEFPTAQWVNAVDAAFPIAGKNVPPWSGQTVVDVRDDPGEPWRTAGWAFGSSRAPGADWNLTTVPVREKVSALRLRFLTGDGTTPVAPRNGVCELRIDAAPSDGRVVDHLARGRPYRIDPPFPTMYGDSGRELTDGIVPEDGYASGKTVGWHGRDVAITFELDRPARIQRVEVVLEGGGYAGIRWPAAPLLLLEQNLRRPPRRAGTGPPPRNARTVEGSPVRIERTHGDDAATGRVVFVPATSVSAKFATVFLRAVGWLMVSEVRIYADGRNIAPSASYTFRPAPTPDGKERYADDGERLTDGLIARRFSPRSLTGWYDAAPRTITIDLGIARPIRKATVWSLGGGQYGIHAPVEVVCEGSTDRIDWRRLDAMRRRPASDGNGQRKIVPVSYRLAPDAPATVRWLRLNVRPSRGWTLLSEIVVE